MKKHTINTFRLLSVVALFAACNGVSESYDGQEQVEETYTFDEAMSLVDEAAAVDEEVAAEEDDLVDKLAGRNGCPNDMTKAASRMQGTQTPETPLYCRLKACVPMGRRATKTGELCFGVPPIQVCSFYTVWEYLAANRNASSIMCSNEIQSKFGL